MKKLAILNTSIMTTEGRYELEDINLRVARDLMGEYKDNFISAVGHESTAQILTTLLGVTVPLNRINFAQEPGQKAIVFKLLGRPQEGKILSVDEIESIGYKFQLMTRIDRPDKYNKKDGLLQL